MSDDDGLKVGLWDNGICILWQCWSGKGWMRKEKKKDFLIIIISLC